MSVARRKPSPSQVERRARIVAAATDLAREGGYEAVAMKDVADRAGVALATVYRYFGSKDHLLAEVLVEWGRALGGRLDRRPPAGATPAARVAATLERAARAVEAAPELARATTAALLSPDPGVTALRASYESMMRDWLGVALGDDDVPDRDGVVSVLEHVFFSTMIGLVNGRRTPDEIRRELTRAVRVVLR